jgi:hypothetical protein
VQRRHDPERRVHPAVMSASDRRRGRRAARLAGDAHHPALGLDHEIERGAVAIGAVLAEAGDRAVDDARVPLARALVVDPSLPTVPTRRFSSTTSDCSSSRKNSALPSGCFRSIATLSCCD